MKSKLIIAIALLVTLTAVAQQGINYKALIKDNSGNVVANQNITVQFTILQGAVNVYQETHNPTTDANGIVIINIGDGTIDSGNYNSINWESDDHFLNVLIDTGSGLTDMGTTQFMAVPYALSASNVSGLEALDEGNGIGWRLIGRDPDDYGNIGENAVDLSFSNQDNDFFAGAQGEYALAAGNTTQASGIASVAMGWFTKAIGDTSIALGDFSYANGDYSIAIGHNNQANQNYSVAIGSGAKALGVRSVALGYNTEASQNFATAMGESTVSSGISSVAMGAETTASGNSSFAMGDSNIASGNTSVALGVITQASGDYSLAMGNNVQVSSFAASALGYNLINDDSYATVVGQNNDNTTTSSALFQVGNGVSTANRTNAFTVFRNGNATLTGTLTQSSDRRLKTNISELPYGLKEILKLKPVNYNWKRYPEQQKSLGLIAQEVQPIINEIVHEAEDKDNTLSVSYTELIPVLIKAIQEQQSIIEKLQKDIEVLKKRNKILQTEVSEIDKLKQEIASIKTMLIGANKNNQITKN